MFKKIMLVIFGCSLLIYSFFQFKSSFIKIENPGYIKFISANKLLEENKNKEALKEYMEAMDINEDINIKKNYEIAMKKAKENEQQNQNSDENKNNKDSKDENDKDKDKENQKNESGNENEQNSDKEQNENQNSENADKEEQQKEEELKNIMQRLESNEKRAFKNNEKILNNSENKDSENRW